MSQSQLNSEVSTEQRQHWMSILARSSEDELTAFQDEFALEPTYRTLRKAETGLVMVRARAGGIGQQFNLGETTVTRCTISLETGEIGHAYISGRNKKHAELAALFDALLQTDDWNNKLSSEMIGVIEARLKEKRQTREAKVAATKVDFFTMVRGENE